MPDTIKEQCSYNDFRVGAKWDKGKLQQTRVKGGCLLVDTGYSITDT